jgi:death-on-curing protein
MAASAPASSSVSSFLKLNGYHFTATEASAAQAILSLAAGTLDEPALAAWLRANVIAS